MKILKKNQLVILVIALMLVAAGYLSYDANSKEQDILVSSSVNNSNNESFGDASLVSSNNIDAKNERYSGKRRYGGNYFLGIRRGK